MQGSSQKNDSSQSSENEGVSGANWEEVKILLMEEIRRSPVDLGSLLPLFARF